MREKFLIGKMSGPGSDCRSATIPLLNVSSGIARAKQPSIGESGCCNEERAVIGSQRIARPDVSKEHSATSNRWNRRVLMTASDSMSFHEVADFLSTKEISGATVLTHGLQLKNEHGDKLEALAKSIHCPSRRLLDRSTMFRPMAARRISP